MTIGARGFVALVLLVALPVTALAQPRGSRSAPASRPAPVSRPAPPPRAPAPQRAAPSGGFNFSHDIAPPSRVAAPAVRPQPVAPQRGGAAATFPHAPPVATGGGPYQARFHGPVVRNPHYTNRNWYWNHGVAWAPAPIYWGGGFWGPWAIAALSTAILFGAIIDYDDHVIYQSYQVEPNSPGAELLANYGLQQTPCGPPNLVVIWGPGNAVICAYPNAMVAPGNYEVDPATLTLTSESP